MTWVVRDQKGDVNSLGILGTVCAPTVALAQLEAGNGFDFPLPKVIGKSEQALGVSRLILD